MEANHNHCFPSKIFSNSRPVPLHIFMVYLGQAGGDRGAPQYLGLRHCPGGVPWQQGEGFENIDQIFYFFLWKKVNNQSVYFLTLMWK